MSDPKMIIEIQLMMQLNLYLENREIFKKIFQNKWKMQAKNLILKEPNIELRNKLESKMDLAGVEYRRGSSGGGNQLRQPYLQNIVGDDAWKNFPEVEHVHHYGWYIGNYPGLEEDAIIKLCQLLNES